MWAAMHIGAEASAGGDRHRLVRELDRLASLGVRNVRILAGSEGPDTEAWWARERESSLPGLSELLSFGQLPTPWRVLPSLQPATGEYAEGVFTGLDFTLHQLAERNMTAVLVLGNMWPWSGGFAQYVSWAEGGSSIPYMPPAPGGDWDRFQRYAARFYGNAAAQEAFLAHVRRVLTRTNTLNGVPYALDPTIMAYQLANEPRPMRQVRAFRQWLDATTALIRKLAPRQLISLGSEGRTPFPQSYTGIAFEQDHAHPRIDYATIHLWPQNWDWFKPDDAEGTYARALNRSLHYVREHVAVAASAALAKPLVLEEFGLARDLAEHRPETTTTWRDRFYADVFGEIEASTRRWSRSPLVAVNFWAWGGEGRPRRPRPPSEPLQGSHCWQPGDALLGDPPHEAAGWYSVFDGDTTTHEVLARFSASLARVDADERAAELVPSSIVPKGAEQQQRVSV